MLVSITAVVFVFLVNIKDEKFKQIPDLSGMKDKVDKPDNAYYAIAGFNAAASENMHVMGYKVIQKFERYTKDKDDFSFKVEQIEKAGGLNFEGETNVLCKPHNGVQCLKKVVKNRQAILALKQKNIHLYNRYRALLGYSKYKEDSFYIAAWSDVLTLHHLHMNIVALTWLEGNRAKATAMLAESIRFGRMMFDNSDLLINHLVATAMYRISLKNYEELRGACKDKDCTALDRTIFSQKALSKNAICLRGSFYSELEYLKRALVKIRQNGLAGESVFLASDGQLVGIGNKYFLQPGATYNTVFDLYQMILKSCDLELHEVIPYLKRKETDLVYTFPWYSYVYNPVGKYQLGKTDAGPFWLSSYIYTMVELEAYQRLLRLQALIENKKLRRADVAEFLNNQPASLKNPYTQAAFVFNENNTSISYTDHQMKTVSIHLRTL